MYSAGRTNIVLIEELGEEYLLTSRYGNQTCFCDHGVLHVKGDGNLQIVRLDSTHIQIGTTTYTSKGISCFDLIGIFASDDGSLGEVRYEDELFLFDYRNKTHQCDCNSGELTVMGHDGRERIMRSLSDDQFEYGNQVFKRVSKW